MSTFRVLACLGALGLILQTPAGQAQSFLGSGPTERFSVPPVGDAMRRPDAPPPATRPAAPLKRSSASLSAGSPRRVASRPPPTGSGWRGRRRRCASRSI